MKKKNLPIPGFFIDSLPGIPDTNCRELLRCIEIQAGERDIYVWLTQLRIAPYSYDFLDNPGRKSPGYIIENLPPVRINTHFLLAFHVTGFEENKYISGRFCVPVNPLISRYFREMYIEYRIQGFGTSSILWCKVKGWYNKDIASKGFFKIFSAANLIMTVRQLRNIKRLSGMLAEGRIKKGTYDLAGYHPESGLHWWIFCRRQNCKGVLT